MVVAPAGTPATIITLINAIINDGLRSAELQDTIGKLGAVPKPGTPEEFAQFIAAQNQKWWAVAKAAKVRID